MDLNIHAEREKPFDFLVFKKQIELFLLRSDIISSNASSHFKDILLTFKTVVRNDLLSKDNSNLDESIKSIFEQFEKFEKSEIFENLKTNEKSIFSLLLNFTKQYIEVLQKNKYYYNDQILHYETLLLKSDTKEMFNFSKKFFMLCLKNRKISFNEVIKNEINKFKEEYGFQDIFYRKSISAHDKVVLLKNLENLKEALKEITQELDLEPQKMSLNGLVSLSLEPTLLGYSSAAAYMNKREDSYLIALGNYKNLNSLKESYIHELAHCFDFSQKTKEIKTTYSEEALLNLIDNPANSPIEKIMDKELFLNSYKDTYPDKFFKLKVEMIKAIEEEFELPKGLYLEYHPLFHSTLEKIINNYHQINTYEYLKINVTLMLFEENYNRLAMQLKNKVYNSEELELKFKSLEEKFSEIRNKHGYVLSQNISYFIPDNKIDLLLSDIKNKKHYYAKPVEIFARAFERFYTESSTQYITVLSTEEKQEHKKLIKEAFEYMSPSNNLKVKRTL